MNPKEYSSASTEDLEHDLESLSLLNTQTADKKSKKIRKFESLLSQYRH